MTIEEQLKDLIVRKYGTMSNFTQIIGMPQSTFTTIMRRGVNRASIDNIFTICKELDISADYLAQGKIVTNDSIMGSHSVFTELTAMVQYMKLNENEFRDFTVDGKALSLNESKFLLDTLEVAIDLIIYRRETDGHF